METDTTPMPPKETAIQDSQINEPLTECQDCGVTLATAEQINKRCYPCMLERKFEKIKSTDPVPTQSPTQSAMPTE